jgi:broad specificity phosphatase PhoE
MRLLLIRHGQSHHEVTNTIADLRGCQGLTPEGLAQARALSERVRRWPDAAEWPILLSSPVPRPTKPARWGNLIQHFHYRLIVPN